MFADFYYDHVSYFNFNSLKFLLELCGYKILCESISTVREFIALIAQKGNATFHDNRKITPKLEGKAKEFSENWITFRKSILDLLNSFRAKGKTVSVWGSGSRGVSLMANLHLNQKIVDKVVDSDKYKWGKYVPGTPFSVISPSQLAAEMTDVIIISSLTYSEEILNHISEIAHESGKKPDVVTLYPICVHQI